MRMSDQTSGVSVHSPAIPKEQLTAFQRWELASFDPVPEFKTKPAAQSSAALITAAEMEAAELKKIKQQAYDEGYASGQQSGYASGIQQAQGEAAKLHTLMQNLQIALTQFDEQLAQSLLDLSLEIAHKMVLEALQIKPEIILNVVNSAISGLPHFNHNAHLILHPEDAERVREQMGEHLTQAGWKIFSDPQIEIGGCRVETAHSNVDASNQSRWKHAVESIGQDKSWLTT